MFFPPLALPKSGAVETFVSSQPVYTSSRIFSFLYYILLFNICQSNIQYTLPASNIQYTLPASIHLYLLLIYKVFGVHRIHFFKEITPVWICSYLVFCKIILHFVDRFSILAFYKVSFDEII